MTSREERSLSDEVVSKLKIAITYYSPVANIGDRWDFEK